MGNNIVNMVNSGKSWVNHRTFHGPCSITILDYIFFVDITDIT